MKQLWLTTLIVGPVVALSVVIALGAIAACWESGQQIGEDHHS